ncbi:hypothetical protein BIU82_05590 [Arthrobacter sp. SW1]|nr:hypothetical protein BIU82_05590 [Arthrobacter sp. SW1]
MEVPVPDLITMMSPSSRKAASTQLDQLRGPDAGDAPKRVELFFCPACFDISDGILSVEVARTADAVTWRAFGWKDEEQDGDADALITNATELVFDAVAYDAVLGSAQAAFRLGFGWRRKR